VGKVVLKRRTLLTEADVVPSLKGARTASCARLGGPLACATRNTRAGAVNKLALRVRATPAARCVALPRRTAPMHTHTIAATRTPQARVRLTERAAAAHRPFRPLHRPLLA
jgi:hypothetical protein